MRPHVQLSGCIWNIMVLSTVWTVMTSASAQETPPGFISIDCGSATQHKDSVTNLTWETDARYILSGMDGVVPNPPDSGTTNFEALRTFRYFREPQSKYCYDIHTATGNISILIRAMFLHGNSSELVLPITFKVYLNATLWNTVQYDSDESITSLNAPKVIEGIFHSPGSTSYVCLIPDHGVPFISSLEFRLLDPDGVMYFLGNRNRNIQFLSHLVRYNLGPSNASTVRYPDDTYDRLWNSYPLDLFSNNTISSHKENANTSSTLNNVPPKVMMDAIGAYSFSFRLTLPLATASSYVYAIFYCQALNNIGGIAMVLGLVGEETEPFNITDIPVMKSLPHIALLTNKVYVTAFSEPSRWQPESGWEAILNAMEIYEERFFDDSHTGAGVVSLIRFLITTFNLSDWRGDPCLPVPYDWITCSNVYLTGLYMIESLNLSKLNDSARLQNSASLLVDNILLEIRSLTIRESHVDDSTFQFLTENFTADAVTFEHLDLSHNDITTFPLISTFNTPEDGQILLTKLNLSYNSLTSFPNLWENSTHGMFNLKVLDLSHNSISSNVSFLSELMERNPYLEEVYVNGNHITGSLDLTTWYHQLEQAVTVFNSSLSGKLYSFVDNDISDIIPNADIFRPKVEFLMSNNSLFNQRGVLLGGNPYCKDIKSLTQRYLCRSTVDDIVYEKAKEEANVFVIVLTSLGGIFLLLLSSMLFIVSWRLWRQLSITSKLLREVQQEFTNRKVQPPFYSYHDLKVATRGFHEDNILGSGAFGAVYKGILSDGSIVAVKKLLNSDKAQVLNEFLSEVALISGIKHKNLIQLKGCCIKDEDRILIYEFAANGNLAEALWGKHMSPLLDWTHRVKLAVGVARGLSYLHEELQPRIIHRDIKAVNVLLDDNLNAKIADFGLAKSFAEEETQAQFTAIAGTRGYFAPEYVLEGQLTVKADVFSFGILLLEIVTGTRCIDSTLPPDRVYIKTWAEHLQKSGTLLELIQRELRDTAPEAQFLTIINIALSCIRTNPKFRPTMSQVVIMLLGNLEAQDFWKTEGSDHEEIDFSFESFEESTVLSSGIQYGVGYNMDVEGSYMKSLTTFRF